MKIKITVNYEAEVEADSIGIAEGNFKDFIADNSTFLWDCIKVEEVEENINYDGNESK